MTSLRLALCAAFAFGAGCALADDEAAFQPSDLPVCVETVDCAGDAVCAGGVCVPPSQGAPVRLSLELDPPDLSGYARTQILDVPLEQAFVVDRYTLPTPTTYETIVTDDSGTQVSAVVSIFGAPRIRGRELEVSSTINANATQMANFRLLEGEYLVRIRPTNEELPGMDVPRFVVRPQAETTLKEFRLPATFRRLYGEVTSSVSSETKLAGVTVRAFGEKSGLPSTIAVSDEAGQYEIFLPATEDTTFRLIATPPGVVQPAWSFEQVVRVDLDADRRRNILVEPTADTIRGSARFQVLGTTADGRVGAPVDNAFVSLTSTVTGVVEPPRYAVSGITDADGILRVDFDGNVTEQVPLLKARYVVRVVPSFSSPYASRQTVLDLTRAGNGFLLDEQVTLSQRTRVQGSAVSRFGRPVAGAFLDFRPLTEDARPSDGITEFDGTFSVDLDPGRYLVVVQPRSPSDAGEALPVTAHEIEVPDAAVHTLAPISVPVGRELRARVLGIDGEPVPGTQVELFFETAGQVVSLGRAEADGAGWFSAVAPWVAEP